MTEFYSMGQFTDTRTGKPLEIQMSFPAEEKRSLWSCRYQIKGAIDTSETVYGINALHCLDLTLNRLARLLEERVPDVVSDQGASIWTICPRRIPVALGYEKYQEYCKFIDAREAEVQAALTARREKNQQ
jgi:hypothetical protein